MNNYGKYKVVENYHNTVVLGADFDATEEAVSDFLSRLETKAKGVAA